MLGIAAALESKVLLNRYVDCKEEAAAETLLERLLLHADPILRRVLARKSLSSEEADQVYSLAVGQIIAHLGKLRAAGQRDGIAHFKAYVTHVAESAFSRFLEAKRPERARLKKQILYVLRRQPGLDAWVGKNGRLVCGLEEWGASKQEPGSSARLHALREDPIRSAARVLPDQEAGDAHLRTLLMALLTWAGHPIELEDMVAALACIKNVQDILPTSGSVTEDGEDAPGSEPADPDVDLEADAQKRDFLAYVWEEVKRLPLKQRVCLLWNMSDAADSNMLDLLVSTGTARYKEIAQALETPWETFVALWKQAPLKDQQIAAMLHTTDINVRVQRHTARTRLKARMQSYGQPPATD